jgi:hypothetical protein
MAGTKKVVTQQTESAEAVENLILEQRKVKALETVSYTHLRAHETN